MIEISREIRVYKQKRTLNRYTMTLTEIEEFVAEAREAGFKDGDSVSVNGEPLRTMSMNRSERQE